MKLLLFFLTFSIFVQTSYAQKYINGPANIRDLPDGKILFQLEDAFQVFVIERANDWYKIDFAVLIENSNLTDSMLLKGTILYDYKLKPIGKTLAQIKIDQYVEPSDKVGYSSLNFESYTYKDNLKDLTIDEISLKKDLIIANSALASVAIYRENGMEFLQKTDIKYEYNYFFDGIDMIRYLVRKTEKTKNILDAEGSNSDISLLFYPNLSEKDTFSYTKHANRFDMQDNMLISTLYGCCGSEDYSELSTFPGNETFLEFNYRYYVISVPNTQNTLMFGFNVEPRYENQNEKLIGELNYSFNHEKSGKVKFIAASKEQLDNIAMYTPEIEFVSMSEKDDIQDNEDYSLLNLWTIDQETELSKISNTGIKITFTNEQNGEKKEFTIIAMNGKINEKIITVDFLK